MMTAGRMHIGCSVSSRVVWLEFGKLVDSNLNAKTYLMISAGTTVGLLIDGLHMTDTGFQFQRLFRSTF